MTLNALSNTALRDWELKLWPSTVTVIGRFNGKFLIQLHEVEDHKTEVKTKEGLYFVEFNETKQNICAISE